MKTDNNIGFDKNDDTATVKTAAADQAGLLNSFGDIARAAAGVVLLTPVYMVTKMGVDAGIQVIKEQDYPSRIKKMFAASTPEAVVTNADGVTA